MLVPITPTVYPTVPQYPLILLINMTNLYKFLNTNCVVAIFRKKNNLY